MKAIIIFILLLTVGPLPVGASNFDAGVFASAKDLKFASEDEYCKRFDVRRAFRPVQWDGVSVCFHYEKVDRDELSFPDVVALYVSAPSGVSEKINYLSGVSNSGNIEDVFLLSVSPDLEDRLFVIYRDPHPNRWFSALYQVAVYQLREGSLSQDEGASDFFGVSGEFYNNGVAHGFPYKNREQIEKSVNSALFRLVASSGTVGGTLRSKAYLYEDIPTADWNSITSSYLIKGDQVTVIEATIGWCKIIYSAGAKPIEAWVSCDSIITH